MAFTTIPTIVTGDVATAAWGNTYLKDNFAATAVGVVITAGDIVYATASTVLARLAIGTANQHLWVNAGATAPEWASTLQAATIELEHATDTTLSRVSAGVVAVEGVTVPTISSTSTLTNKRITRRIGTVASSATPTPDGDSEDMFTVTALAEAATFGAPTGTPTNGQTLVIRILDNGTARTLAWNAIYRASSDLALPTTTILSKTIYLGFLWNSAASKWDLLALLDNF